MSSALKRHPAFAPREPDQWIEVETPGGRVFAAFSDQGISFVSPAPDADRFAELFFERTGRGLTAGDREEHDELIELLAGGETAPHMVDLEFVSPFTRRVLEATTQIERGQTRSYQWLARRIGMPQAARAVGNALGSNPVPIVLPCHRIVHGDGTLGGYAFGASMKRSLLAAEGALDHLAPA